MSVAGCSCAAAEAAARKVNNKMVRPRNHGSLPSPEGAETAGIRLTWAVPVDNRSPRVADFGERALGRLLSAAREQTPTQSVV